MENQALTSPSATESSHRTGPRWNRIFTSAAIAIVAVLAWQSYDTRQQLRNVQGELIRRLAEDDRAAQEARTLAKQGQESIDALQTKMGGVDARLQEAQNQSAALEALYSEFFRVRDERALAEIEQAVNIAAQQLQLAGNVPAALAALQSADNRMALLDQARFLPLRKLVAADMERLRSLPVSDIASVALQLETIMGRIDSLPMGFEHEPIARTPAAKPAVARTGKVAAVSEPAPAASSTPSSGALMRFAHELWGDFSQLIRIERLDQPDAVLLAPGQTAYLRQNLRLRLLSARLALMQREGKLFAEDIHQSRQWLQRYFDVQARPVADTLAELEQIERTRLTMNLPSLETTQTALRGFKLGGKR